MKKAVGWEQMLIIIIIVIIIIPAFIMFVSKNSETVSGEGINIKLYAAKLSKFNSDFNQALLMLQYKGSSLCINQKPEPVDIINSFDNILPIKNQEQQEFFERKLYKNIETEVNLKFDLAFSLDSRNLLGFKILPEDSGNCLEMYVDLNGKNDPNMIGVDTHKFFIKKISGNTLSVFPAGIKNKTFTCQKGSDSLETSLGCTDLLLKNPKLMP